ncbi:antibacterial peptide PMAP-23-like [Camelus ferus]|uniref:Antibacterial peptide PMAP-23-like n=1 Tax=Camelus ferus TaxID=419612 RepID=A0A8B8RBH1_CAMFR|nr:antibacterial peptide PMAP-23-like [Camelus ferus]
METQRASLSLGRSSLWLLLLGLTVTWASAQALSYREAVLRAVDRLNEQSSDPNLYRLLELDLPPKADEDPDAPKPVSFTVKETVCPKRTQLPPEQCDFKENGVVKQCLGTVNLYQLRDNNFDITCNEWQEEPSFPGSPLTGAPGLQAGLCSPLEQWFSHSRVSGYLARIRDFFHDGVNWVRDKVGKVIGYIGDKIRPG